MLLVSLLGLLTPRNLSACKEILQPVAAIAISKAWNITIIIYLND
jgi:hypothetical protein